MKNIIQRIGIVLVALILVNLLASKFFTRIDLTQDKRYTLTEVSQKVVSEIKNPLSVTVYLGGELPLEYTHLKRETKQFLEELHAVNSKIRFEFINPDDKKEQLIKSGLAPVTVIEEDNTKFTEIFVFPWAEIRYNSKVKYVPLLPNTMFRTKEEQLENAVANLEFSLTDAIYNISQKKDKKIAVLSGNGELSDSELFTLYYGAKSKYNISRFNFKKEQNPQKILQNLLNYDLAIIAKPTQSFTNDEKLILDQFINNGGKSMWLIDNNISEMDSLARKEEPEMMVFPRDLNLTDLLFNYGVRINHKLIQDLNSAKIRLASDGAGRQAQYKDYNWFYHPLARTNPHHSITKNVMPVRLRFATQLDTLENKNIKKTPLLVSSLLTKKIGTPSIVKLNSLFREPKQNEFAGGYQLFGLLLEGTFTSAYKNRTLPFDVKNLKSGVYNKMIVVADGDIAKNEFLKGRPIDLGIDKWTRERFGNTDFILNAIDYLLDDSGLIELRNKTVQLKYSNKQKIAETKTFWKFFNIFTPLIILGLFGFGFNYYRKKKYI